MGPGSAGTSRESKKKKKIPKVEEFLQNRDFTGAKTLLEVVLQPIKLTIKLTIKLLRCRFEHFTLYRTQVGVTLQYPASQIPLPPHWLPYQLWQPMHVYTHAMARCLLSTWLCSYWLRGYWLRGYWLRHYWLCGYWLHRYVATWLRAISI